MRYIKNYYTGKHIWAKPVKLPRTVRGQLAFANDLYTKIMLDFTDEDHDLYNPDYGWGRNAAGVTPNHVDRWLDAVVKKQARDRKTLRQPGWRNLWLANSPVYMWFLRRKAWFYICLDCDRGREGKYLRRKQMYSAMGARCEGKWLTAPGTCLECAKEMYAEEVAA